MHTRQRFPKLAAILVAVLACLVGGGAMPGWAADEPAPAAPAVETVADEAEAESESAAEAEPPEPPEPTPSEIGLEILAKIRDALARFDSLNTDLGELTGEDRLVLLGQIGRMEDEILADMDLLAENIAATEDAGLEVDPAVGAFVRDEFPSLTGYLKRHIEESQHDLNKLARMREGLDSERLLEHEAKLAEQNARVDHYYELLLEHADRVEVFGHDGTEARRHVAQMLSARADRLEGRVELTLKQIADLTRLTKDDPGDKGAAAGLRAAQAKLEWTTRSLVASANVLDKVDVSTAAYRRLLIRATGTITQDIFDTEVAFGLVDEAWVRVRDWSRDNAPSLLFRLFFFFLILFMFRLLAMLVKRLVRRGIRMSGMRGSHLLREISASLVANAVFAMGFLIGLSQLGVEIAPLLAGIGVAGFIVGFALQDSLANFAAGAMILIYRPYDVEDTIEAAGVFGRVDRMSLVSTTILTFDNQTLIVPNNKIWGDVIRNITAQEQRRVDLVFRVGLGLEVARIESILGSIVADHPKILDDPEVTIKLHKLADSWMEFVVRPWVQREDYWEVYWDLTRAVKDRFDAENIEIPVPATDVKLLTS